LVNILGSWAIHEVIETPSKLNTSLLWIGKELFKYPSRLVTIKQLKDI